MTTQAAETLEQTGRWVFDEFGDATLGNVLRTRRLVVTAARTAETPTGRMTVYPRPVSRLVRKHL